MGRSRYSRPLPGRDRMYPETDVAPVAVTSEAVAALRAHLPERLDQARTRLVAEHGLSEDLALQLQRTGETERFAVLVKFGHPAPAVARLLTQELAALENTLPDWERDRISTETLHQLLTSVERRVREGGNPPSPHRIREGRSRPR